MRLSLNGWSVSLKALIIGAAAIVTAIVTLMTKGGQVWSAAGWETPDGHDADINVAAEAMMEFQNRWQCDELDELLDELQAAPALDADRIQRVKDRMGEGPSGLRCARFED